MTEKNRKYGYDAINNGEYKAIREWQPDERPRERLIMHGASTLSNAELLAILIGHGTKKFSALDVARLLLETYHSLSELSACDLSEFRKIRGVGDAKAVTLAAAFELGKRIESGKFIISKGVSSPSEIAEYYIPLLRGLKKEIFRALLLNSANQVFRDVVISEGSLNASIVHSREVFRLAISESSASVILMHNHPSGNCEPSKEDIAITKDLVEAGKIIGIKVLDHIIIGGSSFVSMAGRGFI